MIGSPHWLPRQVKCWALLVWILMPPVSALAQSESAGLSDSPAAQPAVDPNKGDTLLNLDIEQLSKVPVRAGSNHTDLIAPSSQVNAAAADTGEATTTTELFSQAPSVSYRRTSALNLDPSVRGYHSSQLNASANGMTQLKTRVDIDSLFSQIDPGIVQDASVIDGPYTSLYGPGFAFLIAGLLPPPRFDQPETHLQTTFDYGSNSQSIYSRDNVLSGGKDWGFCAAMVCVRPTTTPPAAASRRCPPRTRSGTACLPSVSI